MTKRRPSVSDSADSDVAPDPINPADIRLAAMNLLARREHSLFELRRKLRRRFQDEDLVDTQLQRLVEENLQSDQRFAESYARQRAGRGYGPARLRQEMRDKGVTDSEISRAFEDAELDWYSLASEALRKKFGEPGSAQPGGYDIKEKARRVRFMQYRGFSAEHYQQLVDD